MILFKVYWNPAIPDKFITDGLLPMLTIIFLYY